MKEELISVIVLVYNTSKFLSRCLQSVGRQTYPHLEIILVDDGSTDESGQLCDEYALQDSRCRVIHKENGGCYSARNAGHDIATGDWLIFIDSDDYFNVDMLRLMHDAAVLHPEADLVLIRGVATFSSEEDISRPDSIPLPQVLLRKDMIEGLMAGGDTLFVFEWNKLYRRQLIQDLRNKNIERGQDFDFNLTVFLRANECIFLDKTLYWWFQHDTSNTHQQTSVSKHWNGRARILPEKYLTLSPENKTYGPLLLRRLFRDMALFAGWQAGRRLQERDLETRSLFAESRKRYLGEYWNSRGIKWSEKMLCLSMSAFPPLAWLVLKWTRNR